MNDNRCDHFIGYTLDTRHEEFNTYYQSDRLENISVIHNQFDYCPYCGEEIDWDIVKDKF